MSEQNSRADAIAPAIQRAKDYVLSVGCQDKLGAWVEEEVERLLSRLSEIPSAEYAEPIRQAAPGEENSCSNLLNECWRSARKLGYIGSVIAFFGEDTHRRILELMLTDLANASDKESDLESSMHWYPTCLIFWLAGISAVANDNYRMFKALFYAEVHHRYDLQQDPEQPSQKLLEAVAGGLELLHRVRGFNGASFYRTIDRSHCFYETLRPSFEFLEKRFFDSETFRPDNYERLFDIFELFQTAVYSQFAGGKGGNIFAGRLFNRVQ